MVVNAKDYAKEKITGCYLAQETKTTKNQKDTKKPKAKKKEMKYGLQASTKSGGSLKSKAE